MPRRKSARRQKVPIQKKPEPGLSAELTSAPEVHSAARIKRKPFKKVSDEAKPELLHHMQVPPKPRTDEEVRLYQLTTKGEGVDHLGRTVGMVMGTRKAWLTKAQAREHGLPWAN